MANVFSVILTILLFISISSSGSQVWLINSDNGELLTQDLISLADSEIKPENLNFSTYFGGSDSDLAKGIATDSNNDIYIVGDTGSTDFPIVDGYNSTYGGGSYDVILTKFNVNGTLIWSTYLGGASSEYVEDIVITSQDDIFITGFTSSSDFPIIGGNNTLGGNSDMFVAKFNTSGSLIWSTYFGGSGVDSGDNVISDSQNNILITGETDSSDFPIKNPYNSTYGGGEYLGDAFIVKFDSDGSLIWSTFVGGSNDDLGDHIRVDSQDNIILTGVTESTNFPLKNSIQSNLQGNRDYYIIKFSSNGELIFSTYFGGTKQENSSGLVIDSNDNIILSGSTESNDFPLKNAYDSTFNGIQDIVIMKFDYAGSLLWSSYFGSTGLDVNFGGLTLDSQESIVISGITNSSDFPVKDAYYNSYFGGLADIFVAKFLPNNSLVWSSYYGGSDFDNVYDIVIDNTDNLIMTGFSRSSDFPVKNAYDSTANSNYDMIISKFKLDVDNNPPIVSSPSDVSYEEGSTGNKISWMVSDENPGVYNISRNGSNIVLNQNWDNGSIEIQIDGLTVGYYVFTLEVYDEFGNYNTNSVSVTVNEKQTIPSNSSPIDKNDSTNQSLNFNLQTSFMVLIILPVLLKISYSRTNYTK